MIFHMELDQIILSSIVLLSSVSSVFAVVNHMSCRTHVAEVETLFTCVLVSGLFLSASLYVSKRGAY